MAKSSVPGLDRIRELFTSAERAVLESTAGRALADASRKQLDATLAQARALRAATEADPRAMDAIPSTKGVLEA